MHCVMALLLKKKRFSSYKLIVEHVQNAQIQVILHTYKVSSGPLFSIHTFCGIQ